MKTIRLFTIILLLLPILLTAQTSPYFTGDGGRGMRLGIIELQSENLSHDQAYIPSMLQFGIGDIFTKYSAITVIDRQELDRIVAETLDPIFTDSWDVVLPGHIPQFDTILKGIIRRTSTGYILQISVSNTSTGNRIASHSGNYTVQQIDDQTAIQTATRDILTQMGVALTQRAISELEAAISKNHLIAQINLAQGITAQRQGTEVQALSYFFQAAALDPSLFEAVSRSDIAVQNIRTGNIGVDLRNAIAWRNAWVARLRETEEFFHNMLTNADPPYTLLYVSDTLREGNINYAKETMELFVDYNVKANMEWFDTVLSSMVKVTQAVYDGLQATGKVAEWGLENWPKTGVTNTNPFDKNWTHSFEIDMKIVNSNDRVIGQEGNVFEPIDRHFNVSVYGGNIAFDFEKDNMGNFTFEIGADGITDNITIRIESVNGINPPNIPIETITRDEYDAYVLQSEIDKQQREENKQIERDKQREILRQIQGRTTQFAGREWYILNMLDDEILIIAKDIVEKRRFDATSNNWERSEIRRYLNNEFYNAFDAKDSERIVEVPITTSNNTTRDKIFLLTNEEIERYLVSNDDKIAQYRGDIAAWWLRSPGRIGDYAAMVNNAGTINNRGTLVSNVTGGIRPAMWIKL